MGRISTRPRADEDLIRAYATIADDDLEAADRFLDAVRASFERLAALPRMGSPRRVRSPELAGLRMGRVAGFPRFLIFYFALDDGIDVVRVLHSSQDIDAILLDDGSMPSDGDG
jgi:toxin ParE1/3/4